MRPSSLLLLLLGATEACASARSQQVTASSFGCQNAITDTTLQIVQRSEAFRFAVHALAEAEAKRGAIVDDTQIDRLCGGMVKDTAPILDGVALVHTAAVYDIERSFMIFAVHGGGVLLLNPRPDGTFRFGLHPDDWNAFLASAELSPGIADARSAEQYACLLLKYLGNYMPGDPCGRGESARVDQNPNGWWQVEFPRFHWMVQISQDGRVARS